jgi:magnesium transporter
MGEPVTLLVRENLSDDWVAVGVEDTVQVALEKIRSAPESREVFYCYACDPDGKLVGVVPIRKLIRASPGDRIDALMSTRIVKLPLGGPDSLVEDFFVTYRFLAFPVVDDGGRIAGMIELDRVVDTLNESMFEDFDGRVRSEVFQFLGLPKDELVEASPTRRAMRRVPWLLVNIAGGFLAAAQARFFDWTVSHVAVTAAFIPMVLVLSESLGVQTTAVASSMISAGRFDWKEIRRELFATALAGLFAASLVAVLGYFLSHRFAFAEAILIAIALSTVFAASLGAVLPLAFRRFRVDPHLASAPLVLAISDNLTLLVYFSLVGALVAHGGGA